MIMWNTRKCLLRRNRINTPKKAQIRLLVDIERVPQTEMTSVPTMVSIVPTMVPTTQLMNLL